MIRVVITGPPSGTGFFPYKVDWYMAGKPQLVGVSKAPLLDACRQLKQIGLMDDTVVGLFDEGPYKDEWRLRTTVGYGARHDVSEGPLRLVKYKPPGSRPDRSGGDLEEGAGIAQPPPETSIPERSPGDYEPDPNAPPGWEGLKLGDTQLFFDAPTAAPPATPEPEPDQGEWRMRTSDATPAIPSEPPPPRRKRPKPLVDTGPVVAEPAMSAKRHRKRRRGGSGGRRGSRSRG